MTHLTYANEETQVKRVNQLQTVMQIKSQQLNCRKCLLNLIFFYPYVTYLHFKCLKHLQTWNQKIMYANAKHDIQTCPMIQNKH